MDQARHKSHHEEILSKQVPNKPFLYIMPIHSLWKKEKRAMHCGMPTLMEFPDVRDLARFCAEQGFSFLEMNMTFPWFQSGVLTAQAIRELKKQYGIGFTLHLHDQIDPFDFAPELRKGSLEFIRFALDLACELDIPKITMHLMPGTYSSMIGGKVYLYETCKDRYLENVRGFMDFAEERLKGSGTILCIENTSGYQPFHRDAIDMMLASPRFGLTFDIGHCFGAGGQDEPFILSHREKLRHFHIHDCSAKANHLAFGAGGLDLGRYIKMAEQNGCTVVAEVKEAKALIQSKEYLLGNGLW